MAITTHPDTELGVPLAWTEFDEAPTLEEHDRVVGG
jgi:hypothetical protein